MKKRFFICCTAILLLKYSYGQINERDTAKFQFAVSLTGNSQHGNVEVLALKSKIDFSYAPMKKVVLKSQNSSLYQAFYGKKADNDVFSRNYLYYKPYNKLYPFAMAYLSTNYRRKINRRYFVGAGITGQLLNTDRHVIKVSASMVYEQTKFSNSVYNYSMYDGSKNITLLRGTVYAGGWTYLFDKHMRILYDAYWQPAFNNINNYRTQIDAGIEFPFWKGLAFNLLYSFSHENVVVAKILQEDNMLTFGLAYSFKTKHH